MQAYALTVDKFLDHAAKWWGDREIVSAEAGYAVRRTRYADLRARSNCLSGALAALQLRCGDRVATLGWNTQHHLEMYFALMGSGIVCHTLNPRLTVAHLAVMINEAEDRALAVAASLAPLLAELAPLCPNLEHIILMDGKGPHGDLLHGHRAQLWRQEVLLGTHGAPSAWGGFNEDTPAGLCYTSGTSGAPKGVLYTHRSNYLHTLRALQTDAIALSRSDTLLIAVPMFHANGWGLPFAAPAVGAKLVLPGRQTDGASLAALMRDEAVTLAAGIQTLWLGRARSSRRRRRRTAGIEADTNRRFELPGCANTQDGATSGCEGADQLGHDRAFTVGHDRLARLRWQQKRALPGGLSWAST